MTQTLTRVLVSRLAKLKVGRNIFQDTRNNTFIHVEKGKLTVA